MPYFLKGRILDQNMRHETKRLCKTLVINNMHIFKNLNEFLSEIQKKIHQNQNFKIK
jgi:hypothetical protein